MTTKKPPNAAVTAGNPGPIPSANPAPSPISIPQNHAEPPSTSASMPRRPGSKTNKERPDPFFAVRGKQLRPDFSGVTVTDESPLPPHESPHLCHRRHRLREKEVLLSLPCSGVRLRTLWPSGFGPGRHLPARRPTLKFNLPRFPRRDTTFTAVISSSAKDSNGLAKLHNATSLATINVTERLG